MRIRQCLSGAGDSRSAWRAFTRWMRSITTKGSSKRCSGAAPPWAIDTLVNKGGPPKIDTATQTIRNDGYWKGFFPKGHVLNAMSSAIFTGFRKQFTAKDGKYTGITSDTDDRIHARNSLEEIVIGHGSKGTLEPGRYILLRYLDPPWQGFYDIFKIINEDLLIGRVYLGEYPERRADDHLPDVAGLRLRPDDGDGSSGVVRGGRDAGARRAGGRVAHGHRLQREPRGRNRVPAIQQQAGRADGGALPADGADGGTGGPELPEGPLPVERLHAVPR